MAGVHIWKYEINFDWMLIASHSITPLSMAIFSEIVGIQNFQTSNHNLKWQQENVGFSVGHGRSVGHR